MKSIEVVECVMEIRGAEKRFKGFLYMLTDLLNSRC